MKPVTKVSILVGLLILACIVIFGQSFFVGEEVDEFESDRVEMVEAQLRARGISNDRVLEAMEKVPRHLFVSESMLAQAYADHPLPIGEGQTISQPYVVALMTESLQLEGHEKVLEVGTGSGYQAAVLAELCDEVYSIEIRESLAKSAEDRLMRLGYGNVYVKWADGYYGWSEHAPFDAVIITCAVNHVPPYLIEQLEDGGRLILPLGSTAYYQTLTLVEKKGEDFKINYITSVRFVPMIGEALKKGD